MANIGINSGAKLHAGLSYLGDMRFHIETDRLILRELQQSDAEGMYELDSDPLVHRYVGKNPVTHIDQCRKVIDIIRQQYTDNGIGRWAMIEKETGTFAGWTGLKFIRHETYNGHTHHYDLGYRLCRRFWGKGYATESAIAAVAYAFDTLKTNTLYGMAETGNAASANVLQKAGLNYIENFMEDGIEMKWFRLDAATYLRTKR